MSQVKNLRAMFENKGETSPPDRGRSPGLASTGTESPRPLSKVRTSFIAIEKDGRIGLQRNDSNDSELSQRRPSVNVEGAVPSASSQGSKPNTTPEEKASKIYTKMTLANTPIPESPRQEDTPKSKYIPPGARSDRPSANTDKHVDREQPKAKMTSGDPVKSHKATNGAAGVRTPKSSNEKTVKEATKASHSPMSAKGPAGLPAKKPTEMVAKVTPQKSQATLSKATSSAATSSAATTKPATTKPATFPSSGIRKAAPKLDPATDRGIGFVKPKPKSPTRPIKLPSSLTAPTASSVSKVLPQRQSLSGVAGTVETLARSQSRASIATNATSRTSLATRSRPSIGPPPKKAESSVVPKKDAAVDESFLARMMRHTQSSSSKTAEKAPVTPPRKSNSHGRSAGKDAQGSAKRESSVMSLGSAKSATPARKTATTSQTTPRPANEHPARAADPPIVIEQPPSPEAEVTLRYEEPKTPEPPLAAAALDSSPIASEEISEETSQEVVDLATETVAEPADASEEVSDAGDRVTLHENLSSAVDDDEDHAEPDADATHENLSSALDIDDGHAEQDADISGEVESPVEVTISTDEEVGLIEEPAIEVESEEAVPESGDPDLADDDPESEAAAREEAAASFTEEPQATIEEKSEPETGEESKSDSHHDEGRKDD